MKSEQCRKCEYSHIVGTMTAPCFKFLGCYREPYKGKWVNEIDKCPKEESKENIGESK